MACGKKGRECRVVWPEMAILSRAAQNFPYTGTTPLRVTALSGEARNRIVAATSSTFGHAA
jgi:hypothetical protein